MSQEAQFGHEPSIDDVPIRSVDSFESDYTIPNPHLYPGERPETSYVTDGQNVFPIEVKWDEQDKPQFVVKSETGVVSIDEFLLAQGAAPIGERIPVVSYGANVCPAALKNKFGVTVKEVKLNEFGRPVDEHGQQTEVEKEMVPILDENGQQRTRTERPDLLVAPTLYGTLSGFDVVHHDVPGQKGNFFAELYAGPETTETEVSVAISFLTKEQLLMLNATEPSYDLAGIGNVDIGEGKSLPAIFYAGKSSVLLKSAADGALHPVALAAIPARNRELESASSEEALAYVLSIPSVAQALSENVERFRGEPVTAGAYTDEARGRRLAGKKELQKLVGDELGKLGYRGEELITEMPGMHFYSWSNPSLMPNTDEMLGGERHSPEQLIRLPEQELANFPEPNRTLLLCKIRAHTKDDLK